MSEDKKAYDIESAIATTVDHIAGADNVTRAAMQEHLKHLMELQLNYLSQVMIEVSGDDGMTRYIGESSIYSQPTPKE